MHGRCAIPTAQLSHLHSSPRSRSFSCLRSIPLSENIADVPTKSTRKHTFLYLRDKFMYSHCANTTGTAEQ